MDDELVSTDTRLELKPNGAPQRVPHDTKCVLSRGLATWATVDGQPLAVRGSGGSNQSADHEKPKQGSTLVPHPTELEVLDGCDWVTVDGAPLAVETSAVRVPDVFQPRKSGVARPGCEWLTVDGLRVVRGKS